MPICISWAWAPAGMGNGSGGGLIPPPLENKLTPFEAHEDRGNKKMFALTREKLVNEFYKIHIPHENQSAGAHYTFLIMINCLMLNKM